jgi:uncharacterized repeat protein (TIGR03803 family)
MSTLGLGRNALAVGAAVATLAGCVARPIPYAPGSAVIQNRNGSSPVFATLYRFRPKDGAVPVGGLIDVDGTLWGTTVRGGAYRDGTVFSISTTGSERVVHSFGGKGDGSRPSAGLLYANGMLYGTTFTGGTYDKGIVYAITTTETERVLHSFSDGTDGAYPRSSLIAWNGKLYGTTTLGGGYNGGIFFSINSNGVESVLYDFGAGPDGFQPKAGLIRSKGLFYGTTTLGGGLDREGTVFSINASGSEHILHAFGAGPDGRVPAAALLNVDGTLYGTTQLGGKYAQGTVFSLTTSGNEAVVYDFGKPGDGSQPLSGLINVGAKLYGTTGFGGVYDRKGRGKGTVFSIDVKNGAETVLQSFGKRKDGSTPWATLRNAGGILYGTTAGGGAGSGTVFALTP